MNEGLFYEPYVEPWNYTVLGVRLKPLSLGHLLLLHGVQSTFVVGGEPTLEDLSTSIFICNCSHAEALALLHSGRHVKLLSRWSKQLGVVDCRASYALFREYIEHGMRPPHYQYAATEGTPIQCPSVQMVKVTLMRDLHFREDELLDRSWRLCLLDFLTLKAIEGRVAFVDDEMQSEIERARRYADEFDAQLRKEGKLG